MENQIQKSNFYVLFIDDEEKSVKYFEKLFGQHFNVIATTHPEDVWKAIDDQNKEVAVVISDQRMPNSKGVDLLSKIKEKDYNIIRILTTAYSSVEDSIDAINKSNVFAYITKPWEFEKVCTTLQLALKEYEAKKNYLSLSSSIAHEMRNPLHSVRQSAEFIREKLADAHLNERYCGNSTEEKIIPIVKKDFHEIVESLDLAFSSAKRGNIVIDIILDSIRQKPLDIKSFKNISASKMLNMVVSEYSFTKSEKGRVRVEITPNNDFNIRCNETLLTYVFFNLLKNSLYYLKTHPDLTITIKAEAGQDQFNRIYVRDNGPGISQDKIPNLFEPFFTSGKEGGTGLGLAFCKRTMAGFGGSISCNSVEGKFCEFVLAFPKTIKKTRQNRSVNSILLVDDQETNLAMTKKFLEKNLESTHCDLAKSGEEALKLADNYNYDLIIMDIEMPNMDGITTAKKIREFDNETPIIAYSSKNLEPLINLLKEAGFNGCVTKQSPNDIILKAVSKWAVIKPKYSFVEEKKIKEILNNKNILLVDDDNINLILAAKFLRKYSVIVDEARDGQDAINMARSHNYDLILMDVSMPGMNGIAAAKKIREFQHNNHLNPIPIIAFTGENDRQKITEILSAGFDDYFIKGHDSAELTETIAFWNSVNYNLLSNFLAPTL